MRKTKNKFYVDLGFKLRQVRCLNKVSQQVLSEALGVSMQTVQRYETGEIHIPSEAVHKCARTLGTPVGFFYGEDSCPAPSNTNRVGLMVAAEIMDLPDDNIRKSIYQLARSINRATAPQNNERESA